MSEDKEQVQAWPVIVYPTELEIIEKLVVLADGVKHVETLAESFWRDEDGKKVSTITSPEEFERACNFALDCNTAEKRIDTRREEITRPALTFQRQVNGTLKPYMDRINKVRAAVTGAAQAWKKARDKAIADKAEAERKAREEEALERAQRLQASGHVEAANQLLDIAASAPKPVATGTRFSGGSSFDVNRWRGEIADMKSILQAAIEGRIPLDKITISQSYLNDRAREVKLETVIDGIRMTKVESLGLRGG